MANFKADIHKEQKQTKNNVVLAMANLGSWKSVKQNYLRLSSLETGFILL